jgi:hypothetical protein
MGSCFFNSPGHGRHREENVRDGNLRLSEQQVNPIEGSVKNLDIRNLQPEDFRVPNAALRQPHAIQDTPHQEGGDGPEA